MKNVSMYNLINYIKDNNNNNNNNNNLTESFLEKEEKFKIFNNISFIEDNGIDFIIFENKNFVIKVNLKNQENFELSMLDPFLVDKGIFKSIDNKNFNIYFSVEDFFSFIKNKNSNAFYFKRKILEVINDFGIECNNDLLDLNDEVKLKVEDILFLMRDTYVKSLKINNK
jgi:hypothetical protein